MRSHGLNSCRRTRIVNVLSQPQLMPKLLLLLLQLLQTPLRLLQTPLRLHLHFLLLHL